MKPHLYEDRYRAVRGRLMAPLAWAVFALSVVLLGAVPAQARITKIIIDKVQSPTFDGTSFGDVGQYQKLIGRAFGEVDPTDRRNAVIVDISLAPRNARGMVEYSMDILILRPVDLKKGNHRIFMDVNNRGNLRGVSSLNDAPGGNTPTAAADAGNGFLLRQGYTLVSSGWDITPAAGGGRITITVPVAKNADGSSIIGPSLEEFVIDNSTTLTRPLTYAAATLDKAQASLTVRHHYQDTPTPVPAAMWEYVDSRTVRLLPAGTAFATGSLYEFTYPAKDPLVAGLGFAALRDFTSFLRNAAKDDVGTVNPLAGDVQHVYTFSVSQPSRTQRDFVYYGFNEDESGQQVLDGILNWIGGGSGIFMNYRFAQPGRTHRQHIARWYPERRYSDQVVYDPITGKQDGMLRRCQASATCPKIFEINSENEYWAKAGSALHTDWRGNDLSDPPNVRFYLLSSLPHSAGIAAGICQQPQNPLRPNPVLRALLVALDAWVTDGTTPPESRIPTSKDGTLLPPLPQSGMGFPNIPGVTYSGRNHDGVAYDFGPLFDEGILTVLPPVNLGSPYLALVPTTDKDGNDIAGIRLPDVEVPVATYTGWALRAGPAGPDGCDSSGQRIPFAKTKADRLAKGDPRLSIEERYKNHQDYVDKVHKAAQNLRDAGFFLDEDVQRYRDAAIKSAVAQ